MSPWGGEYDRCYVVFWVKIPEILWRERFFSPVGKFFMIRLGKAIGIYLLPCLVALGSSWLVFLEEETSSMKSSSLLEFLIGINRSATKVSLFLTKFSILLPLWYISQVNGGQQVNFASYNFEPIWMGILHIAKFSMAVWSREGARKVYNWDWERGREVIKFFFAPSMY